METITIDVAFEDLLMLVSLMAKSENNFKFFDFLLEIKQTGLSLSDPPERILAPFTANNVIALLDELSSKPASIYADLLTSFIESIQLAIEGKEQVEIIEEKLRLIQESKDSLLNQEYQNGISILRL